jgi:hypothetical protein
MTFDTNGSERFTKKKACFVARDWERIKKIEQKWNLRNISPKILFARGWM